MPALFPYEIDQLSSTEAPDVPLSTLRELYPEIILSASIRELLDEWPLACASDEVAHLLILARQVAIRQPAALAKILTAEDEYCLELAAGLVQREEYKTFFGQLEAKSEGEVSFNEVIQKTDALILLYSGETLEQVRTLVAYSRVLQGAIFTLILPKIFCDEYDLDEDNSDENAFVPFKDENRQARNAVATRKLVEGMQSFLQATS